MFSSADNLIASSGDVPFENCSPLLLLTLRVVVVTHENVTSFVAGVAVGACQSALIKASVVVMDAGNPSVKS